MARHPTPLLSLLLVTALIGAAMAPDWVQAETRPALVASDPPLWVATHEGNTVYLLGSVHMLRPEAYPLDASFTYAFDEAEVVAFELDLSEMHAGAAAMMQRGSYQDGRTLRDDVSPELYEELESRLVAMGIPAPLLEGMKPWMVAMMLSALSAQEAGFQAESGVDLYFYRMAERSGKEIRALETLEEQIEVFDGLPTEAQVSYLETTLEELEEAMDRLDEITGLWEAGDAEELARFITESLEEHPELTERILHQRNRNWIPLIEELLRGERPALVVVGMGHLVGEGSVVALLRERGYSVERLRSD